MELNVTEQECELVNRRRRRRNRRAHRRLLHCMKHNGNGGTAGRQAAGSERARERRVRERARCVSFPTRCSCELWTVGHFALALQDASSTAASLLQRDFHYENYLNKFFELRAYPYTSDTICKCPTCRYLFIYFFAQRLLHYLLRASNDALVLHFSFYLAQILQ